MDMYKKVNCSNCDNDLKNSIEKEKTDIVTAEDIISFRKYYNISQRELTSILDLGKMTINRYEKGTVPSKSYSNLLKLFIYNKDIFKEKIEDAFQCKRITQKTYDKIQNELKKTT